MLWFLFNIEIMPICLIMSSEFRISIKWCYASSTFKLLTQISLLWFWFLFLLKLLLLLLLLLMMFLLMLYLFFCFLLLFVIRIWVWYYCFFFSNIQFDCSKILKTFYFILNNSFDHFYLSFKLSLIDLFC
mgnify:CR=1 FL=1